MQTKTTTYQLCITAIFMAINIVLSSFGLPVPGGHLYLNDIIICTAAILLNPFCAFAVGGIGSFLGDFFFYPTPMFVSLITHGLQAIVISVCSRHLFKKNPVAASAVGVTLGAIIMVCGYSVGRAFFYANIETALLKLPYQILQAVVGGVVAMILCWPCGIKKLCLKYLKYQYK